MTSPSFLWPRDFNLRIKIIEQSVLDTRSHYDIDGVSIWRGTVIVASEGRSEYEGSDLDKDRFSRSKEKNVNLA